MSASEKAAVTSDDKPLDSATGAEGAEAAEDSAPRGNPLVFMDIALGPQSAPERVVFELFASVVPRTAENFRALCRGAAGGLSFKGSRFHRVIPGFVCQGGDITAGDGTGATRCRLL